MATYQPPKIAASEITPRQTYLGRRAFLATAAGAGLSIAGGTTAMAEALAASKTDYKVDEKLTPKKDVTTYNNFYEFGTDKADPPPTPANSSRARGRSPSMAWWASRRPSISTR